ncbi:MAG: FAD-binding protein [Bacteroidaceae bacterium]|nr:FAD-binding protein [Bacteroidaceae bacterium]
MRHELQLRLLPRDAYNEQSIRAYLEREKGMRTTSVRVLRRSIDARQRTVVVNLTVCAYEDEEPSVEDFTPIVYPDVSEARPVVVVGAGPGGLFAALRLIELGMRPIVVERGKDVHARKKDLARIRIEQKVDAESNYSFGEGGAGAYSDGKLFTRSKKRGNVERILHIFVQHGASQSILSDAHPHIGTDRLPRVIEHIRETILRCGGEVHFETRMTGLIVRGDSVEGIEAERMKDGQCTGVCEFLGPVILATGHSARDVYRWMVNNHVEVEAKGIAVGVRLEHPSELIDRIQYHSREGRGRWLPAAEYSMVTQVDGRGVYSFCMCPGGFVVPAASGPEQIVVNGMSPSNRGGRWSNSGMVVEIRPEDMQNPALMVQGINEEEPLSPPLSVLRFQEALERLCWQQGNRQQTAPSQRMADFVNGRLSESLPASSYAPGLLASPLHFWMPSFVSDRLREAFRLWGRQKHGFLTNEATVIGVETRTSSPLRILRNNETLQHVRLRGLFPCGEGAGYAGGIVSAAIDGERCAESLSLITLPTSWFLTQISRKR